MEVNSAIDWDGKYDLLSRTTLCAYIYVVRNCFSLFIEGLGHFRPSSIGYRDTGQVSRRVELQEATRTFGS